MSARRFAFSSSTEAALTLAKTRDRTQATKARKSSYCVPEFKNDQINVFLVVEAIERLQRGLIQHA